MMKSLLLMGVVYLLSGTFFCKFVWQGLIKKNVPLPDDLCQPRRTQMLCFACLLVCSLADNLSAVPNPLMLRP